MEQEKRLRAGDIVQHFKRELLEEPGERYLYEIVGEARHSETDEPYIVYRALYGSRELWIRPLSMFMGEVDRDKYPGVKQKYRFEHIKP